MSIFQKASMKEMRIQGDEGNEEDDEEVVAKHGSQKSEGRSRLKRLVYTCCPMSSS